MKEKKATEHTNSNVIEANWNTLTNNIPTSEVKKLDEYVDFVKQSFTCLYRNNQTIEQRGL